MVLERFALNIDVDNFMKNKKLYKTSIIKRLRQKFNHQVEVGRVKRYKLWIVLVHVINVELITTRSLPCLPVRIWKQKRDKDYF